MCTLPIASVRVPASPCLEQAWGTGEKKKSPLQHTLQIYMHAPPQIQSKALQPKSHRTNYFLYIHHIFWIFHKHRQHAFFLTIINHPIIWHLVITTAPKPHTPPLPHRWTEKEPKPRQLPRSTETLLCAVAVTRCLVRSTSCFYGYPDNWLLTQFMYAAMYKWIPLSWCQLERRHSKVYPTTTSSTPCTVLLLLFQDIPYAMRRAKKKRRAYVTSDKKLHQWREFR